MSTFVERGFASWDEIIISYRDSQAGCRDEEDDIASERAGGGGALYVALDWLLVGTVGSGSARGKGKSSTSTKSCVSKMQSYSHLIDCSVRRRDDTADRLKLYAGILSTSSALPLNSLAYAADSNKLRAAPRNIISSCSLELVTINLLGGNLNSDLRKVTVTLLSPPLLAQHLLDLPR